MDPEKSLRPEDFYEHAAETADKIKGFVDGEGYIRVVSHLDADGIAAASIMAKSLVRSDALFRIRIGKQLDESLIDELASEEASPILFTDFGSGALDLLKEKLSSTEVVVIDHHQPVNSSFPKLTHLNPHLYGLNGAQEISGSGVAYSVAREMDVRNKDLAVLAVIGALGDSQDKNPRKELTGLNRRIVDEAVEAGYLRVERDLIFYGRETRPVHRALAYTTNPFLPGLSGEEDKCLGFLLNLGIELKGGDHWRSLNDLDAEEKQRIYSEIVKLLSARGVPNTVALSLIGGVYTLIREDRGTHLRDAREYASLLNACGRMGKSGLGISIGFGNREETLEQAQELFKDYKKTLAQYMDWVTTTPNAIEEGESVYILRGMDRIDETMISIVSTILISSSVLAKDKPLIALASAENDMLKISGRATSSHIQKGLNLGEIFQKAAAEYEGEGGGHDAAAGAQLPMEFTDDFIRLVDRMANSTLGSGQEG